MAKVLTLTEQDALLPDEDLLSFAFELADCILGTVVNELEHTRPEQPATAFYRLALYLMFAFEHEVTRLWAAASDLARKACRMTQGTPFEIWVLLNQCDVAIRAGDLVTATTCAETVLLQSALNRPAMLRLLYLYDAQKRFDKSERIRSNLLTVNPEADLGAMVQADRTLIDATQGAPLTALFQPG